MTINLKLRKIPGLMPLGAALFPVAQKKQPAGTTGSPSVGAIKSFAVFKEKISDRRASGFIQISKESSVDERYVFVRTESARSENSVRQPACREWISGEPKCDSPF